MTYSNIGFLTSEKGETGQVKVLHVDDDQGFLKTATRMLEMHGDFQVDTAKSVDEALGKLQGNDFDVVVSDYLMPDRTGLDLLEELRGEGSDVPFIVFTGKGREEVAMEALNLGADRYLQKHGDPETVYGELAHSINKSVEKKRMEQSLRQSERKYRLLAENTTDVIFIQDMNHKIKYASPSAERLFGYPVDQLLDLELEDFMTQESLERALENFKEALQKAEKNPDYQIPLMEYEYVRRDGSTFWGEIKVQFLRDQQGRIVGSQGTLRDITQRKESERMYRAVFENTGTAMCISKDDNTITMVNRQFEELSGYPKEEIEGKMKCTEFVSSEHLKMMENYHQERRRKGGGAPRQYTFDFIDKRGRVRNVLITTDLIPGTNKEVASLMDITNQKQRQEVLKRSLERLVDLKEKLEVLSKVTRHDIQNKLSIICNNLYLAKKQLGDQSDIRKYLEEAESAIKQSNKIFDFAKTYETLGTSELYSMDVGEAFENAVHPLFSELQEEGIEIKNQCKGLTVMADQMLTRLFSNLVYNTLQHGGGETSCIQVYCREYDNGVELVFEDDGVGIPEDEKEKVFKEGYGEGNGYGIYLVKKICEVYGWSIQETGKPGEGVRFIITIPGQG